MVYKMDEAVKEFTRLRGVPHPVYVNYSKKSSLRFLVLLVPVIIGTFASIFSDSITGLGIFLTSISAVISIAITGTSGGMGFYSKRDREFVKSLLQVLDGRVSRWCFPSPSIPVSALLRGGLHFVIYYSSRGRMKILLIKPQIYEKVAFEKPRVKIKWIEKPRSQNVLVYGYAQVVFPHPELRNTVYYSKAKLLVVEPYIQPRDLAGLIDSFEDFFRRGKSYGINTSYRGYAHPGQGGKSPRGTIRHNRVW